MRYVMVSDIHGNYDALQAVDQVVKRWRKKGDKLSYWFLGDILGYGPDPIECLKWLRYTAKIGQRWVAGNHDVEVLRLATSGGGGGASGQARESWQRHLEILQQPENSRWWEWFQKEVKESIDNEARSIVVEKHGDLACVFAHGSVNGAVRRTQYLYPWNHYSEMLEIDLLRVWRQHGKAQRTACFFHGHTHYPVVAQLNTAGYGVTFHSIPYGEEIQLGDGCFGINPGSVGQPRDGDPRASFAILDTERRTITFHRVMYNVNNTVEKLEKGGYPDSLIKLVSTANGGANLSYYRSVYRAPELHHLPVAGD